MSEIEEVYKYMAEYVSKFTFPLMTCEADERYDLFGTCVAIEISGKKFLLTASHVVEELIKSKKQAVVALSSGPIIRINLVDAVHFVREGVELDSCIIDFEHAPPAAEFLTNEELFTEKDELFKGMHFIQGYPISKNKMVKINDHDNREVRSGYFSVFLKLDNKIKHRFEKINDTDHVLFYYREGIDYPKGGASREVKKNNMTKLRGLSGCGIWVLNPDSGKVKLAAIFFALKHGVGVGTRVSEIFRHNKHCT